MAKAEWTYEVPRAGGSAEGLEEYVVEASSGERVGKVVTLLDRSGELFVVVERGTPPVAHDPRAVPWQNVESVDHAGLAVRLRLSAEELERALELDPDRGVENGEADATRVTEIPAGDTPVAQPPQARGPVDRPTWAVALGLAAVGLFAFIVWVVVVGAGGGAWAFVALAVSIAFLLAAGVAGYRAFREPYERR
ncbi:MAG: hypothetical protein M3188_07740 [Actinomycetota bacterium]|nr:hypothetical protein [Actinomycetota bacterium]